MAFLSMEQFDVGVVLRPDETLLARHPDLYGGNGERVARLAAALSNGPIWELLGGRLAVAVRTQPDPLIAVLGHPAGEDGPRLEALGWQVRDALERLRPVPLPRVVELCDVLAVRLRARLADDLGDAVVVGIPRGGLLTGALVAYLLGLPAADEPARVDPHRLVVLVDDCALSGARVRRWLDAHEHDRVVVAHLHSAPPLRAAIEADERVVACVAAEDLHDHAPRVHGDGHEAWVARWRARAPADYWTGHPDLVAYVWNEPDTALWNPVTGRAEPGWRVTPPGWCLKNRPAAPGSAPVQVCRSAPGPFAPTRGVIWAEVGDRLVVADARSGTGARLEGVAGDFWRALVERGDPAAASSAVAFDYHQSVERVRADLDRFVATCVQRQLLSAP